MFADMNETRQNRGNALWLPANTGFSTEASRNMQWLLHELSAVISFIPQLSSQKPFLRSSGYDLPSFQHLDWVNNFMSRVLMLPSFLALLLNPMTSDLFPPLSFTWFDPAWRRRRRKRARRTDENTIATIVRNNSLLPLGQVQDFIMPSYPEDDNEELQDEITTSLFSSDFIMRRLPSLIMGRFPLSHHYKESMLINNIVPTAGDISTYSDSIEMYHLLANDSSISLPYQTSEIENVYAETPQKKMNSPRRSIQPYTLSSKLPLPLLINLVTRNQAAEEKSSFWQMQPGELPQVGRDEQVPAHQKVFIPSLFAHPVHQIKSLPLTKWLTTRLQQWFSKNKTSPAAFDVPPEQTMTNSVTENILPDKKKGKSYVYLPHTSAIDTTVSPELLGIPSTSIAIGSQHNFEQTALPNSKYLPPFAFDFQQATYQTAGDLPLAIRNSFSLIPHFQENPEFKGKMPYFQENKISKTAGAIVEAMGSSGNNKVSGYRQTEGMELALAPVGRPENVTGTRETASTTESSTERRSQTEEAQAPAPDYEALATEVYDILKRKLFIEKERAQGIR